MRKINIPPEVIASIENRGIEVGGKKYKLKAMSKNPSSKDGAWNFPMNLPKEEKIVEVPVPQAMPMYYGPAELVLDPVMSLAPGPDGHLNLYIEPNAVLYQNGQAIEVDARYADHDDWPPEGDEYY